MPRGILYRVLLIVTLTVGAVVYLVPSLATTLPEWWTAVLPARKIRLGLDLRGGTHLLLSVDLEKALENALDQNAEELRRALEEMRREIRKGADGRGGQDRPPAKNAEKDPRGRGDDNTPRKEGPAK